MAGSPSAARDRFESARAYLSAPRCAVLSTLDADGAPQQAVVHYLIRPDHLLVNGRPDRHWVRNLRRDARVSIVVHDADQPLHWVGLRGRAEELHEGEPALADAMEMARRYGEDPADYERLDRVSFKVVPTRVFEYAADS